MINIYENFLLDPVINIVKKKISLKVVCCVAANSANQQPHTKPHSSNFFFIKKRCDWNWSILNGFSVKKKSYGIFKRPRRGL